MGGGVAMRAASKVAGIGLLNSGLRGDNPVVSAARQATRSVAAVVSASDDVKLAVASNATKNSSIEKPYVEIDDWEFAGSEDELFTAAREPMPRLVFGGAPTVQEAKQATSDLNDALEKTYLSTNKLIYSEYAETKPCVVSESAVTPSGSKNAIQAFRLLHESSAAQNVVASIASDPNVWEAVLQNEALVDFLQTHKTSVVFPDMDDPDVNDSFICNEIPTPQPESGSSKGFMDFVEDIKQKITVTVVDMMNSLSDTFMSLFGGTTKGEEYVVNPDGTAGASAEKTTIGATLFGLAVMVIMVVALKRA